jgi:hypothetical protein
VAFLERGATVEGDVLANVKSLLPPELAQQLSDIIPSPPTVQQVWTRLATCTPQPRGAVGRALAGGCLCSVLVGMPPLCSCCLRAAVGA